MAAGSGNQDVAFAILRQRQATEPGDAGRVGPPASKPPWDHEGSPAAAREVRGRVSRGPGGKAGGGVGGVVGRRVAGGRRQVPPSWSLPHGAAAHPVSVAWFGATHVALDSPRVAQDHGMAQLALATPSGA